METPIKPLTTLTEESNDFPKEDNSKQYMKNISPLGLGKTKTPLTDISDVNANKKKKSPEKDKSVIKPQGNFKKSFNVSNNGKKKRLKFKQPFIEYINVESYKTFNSLMCFSDPHEVHISKTSKCKECTKCIIY